MQALEDASGKYGEAQLLGFAKGAKARNLYAAAFLLSLKTLTVPAATVLPLFILLSFHTISFSFLFLFPFHFLLSQSTINH